MGFRAGLAVSAVILMLAYVNLVGATATFVAHAATDPAASSLRLPSVLPTIPSPQWPMCVITTLTGVAVETSPPHDLQPCAHTLSSGHRASLARAVARVSYLASCERPPECSWGHLGARLADAVAALQPTRPSAALCTLSSAYLHSQDVLHAADLCCALVTHATNTGGDAVAEGMESFSDAAVDVCRHVVAVDPGNTHSALALAMMRMFRNEHNEAGWAFQNLARRMRPTQGALPTDAYNVTHRMRFTAGKLRHRTLPPTASCLKLDHDAGQLRHLVAIGALDKDMLAVADEYDALIAWRSEGRNTSKARHRLEACEGSPAFPIPQDKFPLAFKHYGRSLYIRDAPAMPEPTLSSSWTREDVLARYYSTDTGMVVIDDVFTPDALAELRAVVDESVVWHDDGYGEAGRGYLGAYVNDGFGTGLLFQVADELRRRLPELLENHRLHQAWAYKYTYGRAGINVHADQAALNVNCWLAPDEHNLDPTTGGMHVYDIEAPEEWTFKDFNGNAAAVFEWLGDRLNSIPNASATSAQQVGSGQQYDVLRVPHRQNRCVIFNSNLFHRTATLSFKPGYRTRRINLTLLFGTRQPVLTKAEKVARRVERDRLLRAQGKL